MKTNQMKTNQKSVIVHRDAKRTVRRECVEDDAVVRHEYVAAFGSKVARFATAEEAKTWNPDAAYDRMDRPVTWDSRRP